jgi:hypothetical protein
MTRRALAAFLALVTLVLAACSGPEGADAGDAGTPVGRWRYAPEILAAQLEKQYEKEGPEVVKQQKAMAEEGRLEMEIRADGVYRLKSLWLDKEQTIAGNWRQEGSRLFFTPRRVDGQTVEGVAVEEARLKDGRIEFEFDRKTFTLLRP